MAIGNTYADDQLATFNVDLAVSSGGIAQSLYVKLGSSSDVSNDVVVCGANEQPIGITVSDCFPPVNGDTSGSRQITVLPIGNIHEVKTITDISRGAHVGTAANGYAVSKTIDTSAPATVIPGTGIALDASTAGTDSDTQSIRVLYGTAYIPV